MNRGNLRADIFKKEADFATFERILHEGLEIHEIELYAYQLMHNHYHLALRPLVDGESMWVISSPNAVDPDGLQEAEIRVKVFSQEIIDLANDPNAILGPNDPRYPAVMRYFAAQADACGEDGNYFRRNLRSKQRMFESKRHAGIRRTVLNQINLRQSRRNIVNGSGTIAGLVYGSVALPAAGLATPALPTASASQQLAIGNFASNPIGGGVISGGLGGALITLDRGGSVGDAAYNGVTGMFLGYAASGGTVNGGRNRVFSGIVPSSNPFAVSRYCVGAHSSARYLPPGTASSMSVREMQTFLGIQTNGYAPEGTATRIFSDSRTSFTATRPKGTGYTYEVIQRTDVNWNRVRTGGDSRALNMTNAEAARRYGLAPQLDDDNFATLHHIGQDARGPLAEASTRYHGGGKPGQDILHSQYGRSQPHPTHQPNRKQFNVDTREYWKWRAPNE